jgi:acetyl esterase/lipase
MDMQSFMPPCPDRPAALRSSHAGRPVSWPILLFSKMQNRLMEKLASASDAQIMAMQRPAPNNLLTRAIFGGLTPGILAQTEQIAAPGRSLDIRLYQAPGRERPSRAILYMHGGGWVFGDIGLTDWICSGLAARTGVLVASLGYRLSPGSRFPAAVEDCYEALQWLHGRSAELGIDPMRIGVAGESAGGNLAAVTCLVSRERAGPHIDFQTLIYPALDLNQGSPSLAEKAAAPILTPGAMKTFLACYLEAEEHGRNPLASPLLAEDLAGLPPALIQVAEHDPIRDDGWRYAARLRAAGVNVRITEYAGAAHGYINFPGLCPGVAARAIDEIAVYHGAAAPG